MSLREHGVIVTPSRRPPREFTANNLKVYTFEEIAEMKRKGQEAPAASSEGSLKKRTANSTEPR
jgi:hypothetical protein